ncbi:MAG: ABC transporter substrate-binding protein [Chloroflexota bacterium]
MTHRLSNSSRRAFLRGALVTGAAFAAWGCQAAPTTPASPKDAPAKPAEPPKPAAAAPPVAPPAATAAPAPAAPAKPATARDFTMFVYSGLTERAYRENFVPAFEAQSGVKVTLDPGWWDMAAKLKVSPNDQPPFDLVMTDPTQGYPGIRDGLFARLDLGRIPNAKKFAPKVLDSFVYKESWGVPFISSAMTLAWNNETVTTPLKSWGDLFSEGLKGEIMLYNAYYMSLFTFAAGKAALDGKPGTARKMIEDDLDGVLQFAKEKRDWVKFWWPATSDAVQALLLKNVKAGNIHGNGLIQPLADNKPLGLTIPQEDRAYVQLFFLVPKNSRDVRTAEDAINFIAGSEFQRAIAEKTGELSANIPEIAAAVAPKSPIWARVYPNTAQDWDSLAYYPYDAYDKNAKKIADFWNREILRKTG